MRLTTTRNIEDIRQLACRRLPRPVLDYLEGGADDEVTLRANETAFGKYGLVPQALRDVSNLDLRTRLCGCEISMPLILSPTGSSRLFHLTGEEAVARAAAQAGTLYALSTMATTSLERVAAVENARLIFQLYVFRDRGFTRELVERCREAGCRALCLTVDASVGGNRERDLASGMTMPPSLNWKSFVSFACHPRWSLPALFKLDFGFPNFANDTATTGQQLSAAEFFNHYFDRAVTWKDAEWLAKTWDGPLLLKGLLSAGDVQRAVSIGASGAVISNHGGRQLDGTPTPIDMMSSIRDAVGSDSELILEGGIRRGTHVLKAIAAGATACSIGRPYLYGLAAGGEAGVARVLSLLRAEIERDMALLGVARIGDINRRHIVRPDAFR